MITLFECQNNTQKSKCYYIYLFAYLLLRIDIFIQHTWTIATPPCCPEQPHIPTHPILHPFFLSLGYKQAYLKTRITKCKQIKTKTNQIRKKERNRKESKEMLKKHVQIQRYTHSPTQKSHINSKLETILYIKNIHKVKKRKKEEKLPEKALQNKVPLKCHWVHYMLAIY